MELELNLQIILLLILLFKLPNNVNVAIPITNFKRQLLFTIKAKNLLMYLEKTFESSRSSLNSTTQDLLDEIFDYLDSKFGFYKESALRRMIRNLRDLIKKIVKSSELETENQYKEEKIQKHYYDIIEMSKHKEKHLFEYLNQIIDERKND